MISYIFNLSQNNMKLFVCIIETQNLKVGHQTCGCFPMVYKTRESNIHGPNAKRMSNQVLFPRNPRDITKNYFQSLSSVTKSSMIYPIRRLNFLLRASLAILQCVSKQIGDQFSSSKLQTCQPNSMSFQEILDQLRSRT